MEEGALSREVKDEEELARWPSKERASFQAKNHILSWDTRNNGVVRSHQQFPMAGVEMPSGSSEELQREGGASLSGSIVPY